MRSDVCLLLNCYKYFKLAKLYTHEIEIKTLTFESNVKHPSSNKQIGFVFAFYRRGNRSLQRDRTLYFELN